MQITEIQEPIPFWMFIKIHTASLSLVGSFINEKFHSYFMWRCKVKYGRYLYFIEQEKVQKINRDLLQKLMSQ